MHFRVAACKRFSFFDTLLLIAKCLNPVSSSASDEDTETSTTADVASDEETTNPIGEVPAVLIATNSGGRNGEQATSKAVTFGAGPALGMTPKRNVKSQLSMMESKYTTLNKSKKMVINRRLHCTGIPLYSANIRGKCIQCERETKWWCAGCHVHCCIADTTDRATDIKYLDVKLPGHGSAEDMVVEGVRYSCYLQLHATAIMALPAFIEENRRGSV